MSSRAPGLDAAIGFRVKTGWATAVLLGGPASAPQVLDRSVVDLSDPAIPESRQPYHAGMGVAQQDTAKVDRLLAAIDCYARRSVADLIARYHAAGHHPNHAGVVISSDTNPEKITNPHIRAHAYEGRLFRSVTESAVQHCGLHCETHLETALLARAVAALGRSEGELKNMVAQLGRSIGGPWRAAEKMAALAAWLALASHQS